MKEFKLQNYVKYIAKVAEYCKCGAAEAVDKFVVNLTVMHEHYGGAPELNYHELGQAWNTLGYKERNKQKTEVTALVAKNVQMIPRYRED